jgi:HPt (histidine-containing phosphotransfer) domain-containing protein
MKEELKQAASQFLLLTYGFDEASRADIIARASGDVLRNCRELLDGVRGCGTEPVKRCAHRLKGNLNALGLKSLASKAHAIESNANQGVDAEMEGTVRDLYRMLSATPLA